MIQVAESHARHVLDQMRDDVDRAEGAQPLKPAYQIPRESARQAPAAADAADPTGRRVEASHEHGAKMSKYDKLDAAIITHIAGGGRHGLYLDRHLNKRACEAVDDPKAESWRVVDRRLQALRKAGRIKYGGQKVGWLVVEAKESA